MFKAKFLVLFTILLLFCVTPVFANDSTTLYDDPNQTTPIVTTVPIVDNDGNTVEPGILPDSNFYWLSNLIDKLHVALTFDPVKKTNLLENQSLKKLAVAQTMTEQGKGDLAEKALSEYSDKVIQAQQFLDKLKDTNSQEYQNLQESLTQTNAKNIQTLSGLINKLSPQAAANISLNIVKSMEKLTNDKNNIEDSKKIMSELTNINKNTQQKVQDKIEENDKKINRNDKKIEENNKKINEIKSDNFTKPEEKEQPMVQTQPISKHTNENVEKKDNSQKEN